MPEFVHVFQSGRMNKDLDERLVPNGEYRDALNLDLANSDNGNIGSLQNVQGTIELRGKEGTGATWTANFIDALSNPVCIGSYRNDITERIYWFIASDNISAIAEYDQVNNIIKPVLVDTQNILNFSEQYLITAINIIDNFLFWTDDQTEPKKINIEKFKIGSTNFTTHTKIPKYNQTSETYSTTLTGQPDFTEADVTVIKKSPLTAPTLDMSPSKFGNDVPGTGITPVETTMATPETINFTYVPDTVGAPDISVPLDTYGQYLVNIETDPDFYQDSSLNDPTLPNYDATYYWNGEITFEVNTIPQWQVDDLIVLDSKYTSEFFIDYDFNITLKLTEVNNTTITGRIQAISSEINEFIDAENNIIIFSWEGLLVEESPLFEYIFPRFGYRWKYIDNEYSTFSPFSEVAFEGGKFEYLSSDGYNVGMTNNIRKLIIESLTWGSEEVVEIDLLYKESNSNAVYVVDTLKKSDYTNLDGSLKDSFQIKTELIGQVVESNQILRPWDNVPRKAKSQEIIGNRIVYGNYLQNYNVPTTTLNLTVDPNNHASVADPEKIRTPEGSVKSIRTYQAGVVYKDAYGRETPVFTSQDGSCKIDIENASKVNKLVVSPTNTPPDWATHYKFFIKETSNQYYNLALDRFYNAEDGNIWLSFPSAERNKVDEETYLILKKQHDTDTPVTDLNRYKILAIENEAPRFISQFDSTIASARVSLISEVDLGFLLIEVEGPNPTVNPQFGPSFNGNKIDIKLGGSVTDKYEVDKASVLSTSGDNSTYQIILKRPLGPDAGFLTSLSIPANVEVTIYEEEQKIKPEFEGRFFVKINRDFAFDTNIISSFSALETRYAILDELTFDYGRNTSNNPSPSPRAYSYSDNGCDESESGCGGNSYVGSQKLIGWGQGVGSLATYPGCSEFSAWQPVTRGSKIFGVQAMKSIGYGGFIDKMFGNVVSQAFGDGGVGASPNGYLSFGQTIRFQNSNPNAAEEDRLSQVYTITYAIAQQSKRGKAIFKLFDGGCQQSSDTHNFRYAIYIELNKPLEEEWFPEAGDWGQLELVKPAIQAVDPVISDENDRLSSTNPAIFETEPKEAVDLDLYYEASNALPIANYNNPQQPIEWYNCYSYGNGVEPNRIRDDFNAVTIDKGVKVSTVLDEPYSAERRGSGFIFSQIYNSTSGINRLNQFIQAEPITKDLNPIYGTIQKLHARDTDLIALCEDKCLRVLANKDALYNADGNVNLTGNTAVLGQAIPYAGEYGISKNPESFADYAFRAYFSDKNRGAVIRLSRDGITVISENGMSDFFADNLRSSNKIIGSYDEDKGIYNITLNNLTADWQKELSTGQDYNLSAECENPAAATGLTAQTTVSFKEEVTGWTSRKSFIPESGISLNNIYYTFKGGEIWEHNASPTYNNFYGDQYNSSFNVLINELPQIVKGYSALNYTGTKSRELEYQYNNRWYSIAEVNANQIIPTSVQVKREGWLVNYIRTNLEAGEVKEFENKEGKYFNYIKALDVCKIGDGIGVPDTVDPDPQDYILTVTIDESCSSATSPTPDAVTPNLLYIWQNDKPYQLTNIITNTTNEGVVCDINAFYNPLYQNYTQVSHLGQGFRYFSSDGFQVGTQLYNYVTLQPLSGPRAYVLYPQPGAIDNAGLDPNNSSTLSDDYEIVLINAQGEIASITQYNTVTCTP